MIRRVVCALCAIVLVASGCSLGGASGWGSVSKRPSVSPSPSGVSSGVVAFPDRSKSQAVSVAAKQHENISYVSVKGGKDIVPGRYEMRLSGLSEGHIALQIYRVKGKVTGSDFYSDLIDVREILLNNGSFFTVDISEDEIAYVSRWGSVDFKVDFVPVSTHLSSSPSGPGMWIAGLDISPGRYVLTGLRDFVKVRVYDTMGRTTFLSIFSFAEEKSGNLPVFDLAKGDTFVYTAQPFPGLEAGGGKVTLTPTSKKPLPRVWKDTAPDKATGKPVDVAYRDKAYLVGRDIPAGYYRVESATGEPLSKAVFNMNSIDLVWLVSISTSPSKGVQSLDLSNIGILHLVEGQEYNFNMRSAVSGKDAGRPLKQNPAIFRLVPIDKPKVNVKALRPGAYMVGRDIPPGVYEFGANDGIGRGLEVASPQAKEVDYFGGFREDSARVQSATLKKGQMIFVSTSGTFELRKKK